MRFARHCSLALLCALSGVFAVVVPTASAEDIQVQQFSFRGENSSVGPFGTNMLGPIAIDQVSDYLYARDLGHGGLIHRFDLQGNAVPFTATDTNVIPVPKGYEPGIDISADRLSVDNSPTATQGNIYMNAEQKGTYGFSPAGTSLAALFPVAPKACSVAVSPVTGLIWTSTANNATAYLSTGATAKQVSAAGGCQAAFDPDGDVYTFSSSLNLVRKFSSTESWANLGSIGDTGWVSAMAVDPTTKEIWVAHFDHILAYRYTKPLVSGTPFARLDGFDKVLGLAFDADGNLYVGDRGVASDPTSGKVHVFKRQPASAPVIQRQSPTDVRSTSVILKTSIVPAGAAASVHFEYGTDASYGSTTAVRELGNNATPYAVAIPAQGLASDTTYHFRTVATSELGVTYGPDRTFTTFPAPAGGVDPCPNALARKQTAAVALLDCRAYELVSARDTGGYDVESSLVPGQEPFQGYPEADGKALYALHAGALPISGNPTNRGPDPYLATRGVEGWTTRYVGLPSNINGITPPFSSTLAAASGDLSSFAFGGAELCDPCFTQGIDVGVPLRMPDGSLVQGMAGSLDPGPGAAAAGGIAEPLSADGSHLVFSSTSKFEPQGLAGELTIYSRDLDAGVTRVVSRTPAGTTMTAPEPVQLDISADGFRVIVSQAVSEDGNGNVYRDLYQSIEGLANSVELVPGSTVGVLYAGATADGSRVFFTSDEALADSDTDADADLYAADVTASGEVSLTLISQTSAAACDPVSNSERDRWNSVGPDPTCDAVAIAGGGGIASDSGDVYFLSPQAIGGDGLADEPNLYLAKRGGGIEFVATLEPDNAMVLGALAGHEERDPAVLQVTPSGNDAVFTSGLSLTGAEADGDTEVFHYEAGNAGQLACASCDPTESESPATAGDAFLTSEGLSITDDGRVFFTTPGALVLNDTNTTLDVYQWADGEAQLISNGIGQFESGLLSVSADGVDVFFFTHEPLAGFEDENRTLTRLYDARSGGGFFAIPPPQSCKASDECHGPGTSPPPPPAIRTAIPGGPGNVVPGPVKRCKKGQVKKRGKCVKRPKKQNNNRKTNRRGNRNHG